MTCLNFKNSNEIQTHGKKKKHMVSFTNKREIKLFIFLKDS